MQPIIELKRVWKTYEMGENKVHALRGIYLQIFKGEFVAVVGHSGSGKSTMLNLIGCLDVPSQGEIYLKNRNIAYLSESNLASLRGKTIGFIFQQFNLIPTLTALENVSLPMLFQDTSAFDRKQKASMLLNKFGLGNRMLHKPTELSGGQSQRVAIARSLVNNPEVILADEPTGNLDSKTGEEVMEFLSQIHRKDGKTVVLITHDLDLVHHADRIVYLKDGQVEKITKGGKK